MTIERLYTTIDDADVLRKAFPEYTIINIRYSNDLLIYEKRWFGRLRAILNREHLSCVCNHEELALKLDEKFPKLKIKLYTELVDL